MPDPRQLAAERIYAALIEAQRDADGDAALCQALDKLAQSTTQNKFRHAAGVIRGTKLGRHAIDDKAALRHIAAYPAAQRREAVGKVARQVAGVNASDDRVEAIAQRLRRKLRGNETNTLVKFAAPAS